MPRVSKPQSPKPVIVCDTREQTPWKFSTFVNVVVGTLHTGDYSLAGFEDRACVERKSLEDYVGTVVNDYFRRDDEPPKRFERELIRMQSFDLRAIIVEGSWADLRDGNYASQVHPSAIFGATCCLMVDYRVPVLMCHDRAIASRVCERLLRRYFERRLQEQESA